MKCKNCGNELGEGEKFCGNCGNNICENTNNNKESTKGIDKYVNIKVFKLICYILAIVTVIMFFSGANEIMDSGDRMSTISTSSGNLIDEIYYRSYGNFLAGLAMTIKALGLTCSCVLSYIGRKIK